MVSRDSEAREFPFEFGPEKNPSKNTNPYSLLFLNLLKVNNNNTGIMEQWRPKLLWAMVNSLTVASSFGF